VNRFTLKASVSILSFCQTRRSPAGRQKLLSQWRMQVYPGHLIWQPQAFSPLIPTSFSTATDKTRQRILRSACRRGYDDLLFVGIFHHEFLNGSARNDQSLCFLQIGEGLLLPGKRAVSIALIRNQEFHQLFLYSHRGSTEIKMPLPSHASKACR